MATEPMRDDTEPAATPPASSGLRNVRDAFAFAWDALRVNKVRTGLTALGMVIGTASVILVATIALTSAPIARLSAVRQVGPPAFFGLTDLFIVAMLVYDLATRRKVHPATIWGGLVIVASQPLRLMISGTPAWLAFAGWLTSW